MIHGRIYTPKSGMMRGLGLQTPTLTWNYPRIPVLPIEGSIGLVQKLKALADSAGTIVFSAPFNVTNGNLLIVTVSRYTNNTNDPIVVGDLAKTAGTSTIGTIALDSSGQDVSNANDFIAAGIFSVPCTGSGSLTFTYTGNAAEFYLVSFQEWTGLQTVKTAQASANGSSATPASGGVVGDAEGLFIGVLASNSVVAVRMDESAQFELLDEEENGAAHAVGAAMYCITDQAETLNARWGLEATGLDFETKPSR